MPEMPQDPKCPVCRRWCSEREWLQGQCDDCPGPPRSGRRPSRKGD